MKIFNKILLVIVSVIAIYAAGLIASDISSISEKISLLKIEFIPIILGLVTIGWGIMFLRWNLLLRNEKIFIPIKDSFLIYISGFALSIIPGKVGEFIKSYLLKAKFGVPETKTIPIVILEQLYTVIGIIIVSFFGIWYFELGFYVLGIFAAGLTFMFVLLSSRKIFTKLVKLLEKKKFTAKFATPLSESYDSIKNSMKSSVLIYASGLSTIFWFIEAISVYFVLLSFGIDGIEFIKVIPTYTTSIMLGILSFLPMGIGVVEGSLTSFFSLQGIEIPFAVTIVIVIRILTRWYSVLTGFIALKFTSGFKIKEIDD